MRCLGNIQRVNSFSVIAVTSPPPLRCFELSRDSLLNIVVNKEVLHLLKHACCPHHKTSVPDEEYLPVSQPQIKGTDSAWFALSHAEQN